MNEDDEIITETKLDAVFKNIIGDSYILAKLLSGTVSEYENMDPEEIRRYLPIEEGRVVRKGNQEFINANNRKIEADSIYELTGPYDDKISLIVNIEGQGDPSPGYPLINRMLFYTCMMISNQKGIYFDNNDYDKLRNVVSIWVVINPNKKDKNRLKRYTMIGKDLTPFNRIEDIVDKMELIVINIGDKDDSPSDVLGMLNTLFAKGLDDRERAKRLEERYNIPDADYVFGKIRGVSMSIEEELHNAWKREWKAEGVAEGRVEASSAIVQKLIENGYPEDKALEMVPEDVRDEVRSIIGQ